MNSNEQTAAILERIAVEILGVPTLEERKSDGLDFHDIGIVSLKHALEAAFKAGKDSK